MRDYKSYLNDTDTCLDNRLLRAQSRFRETIYGFLWSTVMPDETRYMKSRYHDLQTLFITEMLEIGLEVWTAVAVAVRGELSTCMQPK